MGIKKEAIEKILDEYGVKFQPIDDSDDSRPIIGTGWSLEDPEVGKFSLKVLIILDEKGKDGSYELVHVRAVKLSGDLKKPLHELEDFKLLSLYRYMAGENYSNKLGTWGFDEKDGDINISCVIPVEDGTLTAKQLMRALAVITQVGKEGYRNIRRIAAHGDWKKPLPLASGIPQKILVKLTRALLKADQEKLTEKLEDFRGDVDALEKAVDEGNWDEAKALLESVPDEI